MKEKEIIKAKEELANLYLILKIRKKEEVNNNIYKYINIEKPTI